jgi:hypothetical protein
MKIALAVAAASMLALSVAGSAQDARPYENGPVWDFSMILTKPGHFDDYMKFVDTTWKAEQEALKAKGTVLSYKVFNAVDPRDGEPDLVLAVEYKNMGVMDVSLDEQDVLMKKIFGSMPAANKADIDRESIRTLKGDILTRELILK